MDRFESESRLFDREVRREASELIKQGYFPYDALCKAAEIVRDKRRSEHFNKTVSNSLLREKD